MKKKIEDALRTEYAGLGLSANTIGRLADFVKGLVEKEEDIATAVKRDDVKLIATSIQGEIDGIQKAKKKAEDDLADYKAKHPETKGQDDDDPNGGDDKDDPHKIDWEKTLAKLFDEKMKPLQAEIESLKNHNSTAAALSGARESFFGGDYAKKYKDDADAAWERAVEVNELTGNKMTADELTAKAKTYFDKYVSKKGVDTSKPFKADPPADEAEGTTDWAAERKRLQDEGRLPKE